MTITFVLHEATRTGAPRLGALIARELQAHEDVSVLVMKDGPLTPWLKQTLGAKNVVVGDGFDHSVAFEERVRRAGEMLARAPADLVYVNSLASSVFAFAAAGKSKVVLHVHEKEADMANLLLREVTKLDAIRVVDAVVLAASDIEAALVDVFRFAPPEIVTFGSAIDIEAIRTAASRSAPAPRNARDKPLHKSERLVVCMSGHASRRKGVDIFFETAAGLPQHDFLWIGGWTPEETIDNIAWPHYLRADLPNLHIVGSVENPYPYMAMADVFFLSSREDPNPLVLGEALALQIPVLAFSRATGVADRLGRWATLLHGEANTPDAIRVLGAMSADSVRRPEFRRAGQAFVGDYDLKTRMGGLRDLIGRLRGQPVNAPIQRELEHGIVELQFS